jgi:hypothetical protein
VEQVLYDFALWLASTQWSVALHESFYMFNWMESTHVLFLMISLGMLIMIDLRMLGWALTNVPASKIAARIQTPMFIGFTIMVITGVILFTGIPIRYTHSVWFRFKLVLLFVALINAILFHRQLNNSVGTWDTDKRAPKRIRIGAGLSLTLWVLIVFCGRFIAYDWFNCGTFTNPFMLWVSGCAVELANPPPL